MIGAAGRSNGSLNTYLAVILVGRFTIRIDLLLSAVFTLMILLPQTAGIGLFGITFIAGFFIYGRGSLLQNLPGP